MKFRWLSVAAAALVVLAAGAPAHGQSFGFPWWKDAQFQRDLSLTQDQSAKIDAVFQQVIPGLRQRKTELDAQEEVLSHMIANNENEALVTRQVDKVETIRAEMNKTRTLMLLHMRQVLSPEQRKKLNKLHEQWEKDHRREHAE
ncbi:MAG TPA: Spy/CpxP family protein refolding chaperone [Vicinamibacterales bacterium]|jgi:Spy/CpxP family protein refolding chaperone|nr:Spy/CpxP family protein refolding chaperone [Vicinamibacterales bacterium]